MPKAVLLGLAIVLVVAGGCGERRGGGREGESFRADADAACTERQRALIRAYDTAQQDGKSGAALDEATVRAQVDGESGLVRKLREIDPPKGLEHAYSEFLTTHEHRRAVLEAADEALERGDSKAAEADFERVAGLQDEVYALGRALDLGACAGAVPGAQESKVRAAVEQELADRGARSVEIIEIEGNDQYAEVELRPSGGRFDAQLVDAHATRDGEQWSVAAVEPVGSGR